MVLKRPYAFLIKHFQKIHFIILVLCGYIFYKNAQFSSFVQEYLSLGTYHASIEPVDQYVNVLFYIVSILIIVMSSVIIYLLHYKKKPYRFYLFLILEYAFMLGIFIYGANYFHTLTNAVAITKVLALRDLLFIASLPQYVLFVILAIRTLGLDLKKFGFQDDKEFLGLEEKDNEEFEFELHVDKDNYKREFKKRVRYLSYFYQENKKVIQIIGCLVLFSFVGFVTYYFGVLHKVYKIGEALDANQYTIQVNRGYITNRDYRGNLILPETSNKTFVVLEVTITNHASPRSFYTDRFHLMNGLTSSLSTLKYNQSFTDLGTPYTNTELKRGESKTFLFLFQVENNLNPDKFVLTYQEIVNTQKLNLKKVKLSLHDLSSIKTKQEKKLGEEILFTFPKTSEKGISILESSLTKEAIYYYEKCYINDCAIVSETMTAAPGKSILKLSYVSDEFETTDLIDFLSRYGTINYRNNNKTVSIPIVLLMNQKYQGNELYLQVPDEVEQSETISLTFVIRDQRFHYQLK